MEPTVASSQIADAAIGSCLRDYVVKTSIKFDQCQRIPLPSTLAAGLVGSRWRLLQRRARRWWQIQTMLDALPSGLLRNFQPADKVTAPGSHAAPCLKAPAIIHLLIIHLLLSIHLHAL
jgi:hypothetical protein